MKTGDRVEARNIDNDSRWDSGVIIGTYNEESTPTHDSGWLVRMDDGRTTEVSYEYEGLHIRKGQD